MSSEASETKRVAVEGDGAVRVGIDVGGTFTHAVALDAHRLEVRASVRVPTTHASSRGIAAGILEALDALLEQGGLDPSQVERVAHSTTQATNALLEGDLAPVGVLCVGQGWEGKRAAGETRLEDLELSPGRSLEVSHRYCELVEGELDEGACRAALGELVEEGAEALVLASAFSVDDPRFEQRLRILAEELSVPATATHEVSGLHGLRLRTRTAAVNASLMPRMLSAAEFTEEAVRARGIEAPLVVMRSDGGAMDIEAMKRRPLLTMLSGPAAGLAAALMWARVSDGIFLEVGGTSTDVSCIKNGRPFSRPACIGSHRLYLDTLDVRTLGVAGGSMVRLDEGGKVRQVGPRSAHIAGLEYACFSSPGEGELPLRVAPRAGDPGDHLALGAGGEPRRAFTPSCAARYLGRLDESDRTATDPSLPETVAALAAAFDRDPGELAAEVLREGAVSLSACVEELAEQYRLDRRRLLLVGGGGGAAVWIPELVQATGGLGKVVPEAPVLSAIGAACALLQETVERTLLDPAPEDFRAIRAEAEERLLEAGAAPETVEVRVEVDSARSLLRAVALGSHHLEEEQAGLSEAELLERARGLFRGPDAAPEVLARTRGLWVFGVSWTQPRLFGLLRRDRLAWRVLDARGRVRLGSSHGEVLHTRGESVVEDVRKALGRLKRYGDAGGILPPAFLLAGSRSVDLSGLPDIEGRVALVEMESGRLAPQESAALVVNLEER